MRDGTRGRAHRRVGRVAGWTLLGCCALLAGCSSAPAGDVPRTSAPSGSPSPSAPSAPPSGTTDRGEPSPSPSTPARVVRIALVGDVHFEGVLADRLDDPRTALAPVAPWLSAADVTIANLETSVGTGGTPAPGKRFVFDAGPSAFDALASAGVDVAVMANNHALDMGRDRLPSTFRAARRVADQHPALSVIGIGRAEDEAFRPAITRVRGTVVATLAASVADQDPTADPTRTWAAGPGRPGVASALDPARLVAEVARARDRADVVVVYLHWGVQGERCPSPDQRRLARRLVAAGADVVAGSHAHVLQGDGRLGRGYVAYGLGNFAWYSPGSEATSRTGVLTLTIRPSPDRADVVRATWRPAQIGVDGLPTEMTGTERREFGAQRADLRACAGLS